jgi:regulator of replication initiation timing
MSKVVVVLGPGRSGTSLMMQLLHAAGIQLPCRLKPADANNPMGTWEDAEILRLHRGTRSKNPWRGFLPLRDGPVAAGETERIRQGVRRIVQERVKLAGDRPWGFKDPRTCFFLPIWSEVFDEFGIEPIFIHCFRSPAAFAASYLEAYSTHADRHFSLWIYFWRTYYGLKHTNLTGYFAHYEDWDTDFAGQMKGVAAYCGLDLSEGRMAALRQVYRPKPRRSDDPQQAVEPVVADLYRQLRNCTGILPPESELKSFIERVDLLLLQFGSMFDAMYASLDEEGATKATLQEAREEAAELRVANANLLQRLDNKAQTEWAEAVNEARRARAKYEEARQAFASREQADDKDVHNRVGRKVARGIARSPFHALAALADVYTMREEIQKSGKSVAGRADGKKTRTRQE